MTATAIPFLPPQFFDANGDPANGAQLFVYSAGTTTKVTTYTNASQSASNTNPIVLDSAGRCTIFIPAGSYKFVLAPSTDSDPPTSPYWTRDNISAIPTTSADVDVSGTAGEALTALDCVYLSDGSGGGTAGRWYKADADNTYSSTRAQAVGFVTADASAAGSISVRCAGRVTGLAGLVAGSTYYISATAGAITTSAPTNARTVGEADASGALVIVQTFSNLVDASSVEADSLVVGTTANNWGIRGAFKPGGSSGYDAETDGILYSSALTVTTAGTSEEAAYSYTVPANVFNGSGRQIEVTVYFHTAANANNKVIKFYYGSASVSMSIAANDEAGVMHASVGDRAANAQRINAITIADPDYIVAGTTTATETNSGTVLIKLGLLTATAAGDITIDAVIYRFVGLKTS